MQESTFVQRQILAADYPFLEHYRRMIYPLLDGVTYHRLHQYVSDIDKSLKDQVTVLYTKFNDLIKLLLEPADYEGAAQCFKDPESCPRVTDVVVAAMQNLTVPEQMNASSVTIRSHLMSLLKTALKQRWRVCTQHLGHVRKKLRASDARSKVQTCHAK